MNQAELAKLEHAFAADPASEAYRALAEAYLSMGRFMEAMVVCKKGAKAHPQKSEPRVLLARVYAAQGKDKKALEELSAALALVPSDASALLLAGDLSFKSGDAENGKKYLLQAYQQEPGKAETLTLLKKWDLAPSQMPAAPRVPEPALVSPPVTLSSPPPAPAAAVTAPPTVQRSTAVRSASKVPQRVVEAPESDVVSEEFETPIRPTRANAAKAKSTFRLLLVSMVTFLAIYAAWGRNQAKNKREMTRLLNEATAQLKHDTANGYGKAIEALQNVLDVNDSSPVAHGALSYAYAVRWGEHAGDDKVRDLALEHLKLSLESGSPVPYAIAAEALLKLYSGQGAAALLGLEERMKVFEKEGQASGLLFNSLGLLRMNSGDMEGARQALEQAQELAPDDARTYSLLGTFYQRRGQTEDARRNYYYALRYEPTHAEAAIGKAFVLLDRESPDEDYIEASNLLKSVLESQPPPSRRHVGAALMLKSLLITRVGADLPRYTDKDFKKTLSDRTGVGIDEARNKAHAKAAEHAAFNEDRKNPELYLMMGRRLFHEEDYDGAAKQIRQAIQMDSMRAHFHVELARALMEKKGGEKEPEEALKKALGLMPESPRLRLMLGNALLGQNKVQDAMAEFERAIAAPKTKNPEARLALGRLVRDVKKDYARAKELLQQAGVEFGNQSQFVAQTNTELGLTLEAMGDSENAEQAYRQAMESDDQLAAPVFLMGRMMLKNPREKRAAKDFFKAYLKMAPDGAYASEARDFL